MFLMANLGFLKMGIKIRKPQIMPEKCRDVAVAGVVEHFHPQAKTNSDAFAQGSQKQRGTAKPSPAPKPNFTPTNGEDDFAEAELCPEAELLPSDAFPKGCL